MPKGNKYGTTISVKKNGMRAIAGETGIEKRRINTSQARENLSLEQLKESMITKPFQLNIPIGGQPKDNIPMNGVSEQKIMKMNKRLVNKANYQDLRKAKDMSNDLSKKVNKAVENMPRENIKSQDDINNYIASVIGGEQGEMLKKMLETTLGK